MQEGLPAPQGQDGGPGRMVTGSGAGHRLEEASLHGGKGALKGLGRQAWEGESQVPLEAAWPLKGEKTEGKMEGGSR